MGCYLHCMWRPQSLSSLLWELNLINIFLLQTSLSLLNWFSFPFRLWITKQYFNHHSLHIKRCYAHVLLKNYSCTKLNTKTHKFNFSTESFNNNWEIFRTLCVWSWALYLHFRYLKCLTFELSLEPSNFSIGGPRSIPLLIFSFICLKNSAAIFNLHKNHNLFWHETLGGADH